MSWSTSELRVRLAPLNRFKPFSKIFYWPFQGGTSFVDLLCFCSVLCLLCFVRVCLYVLRGHLLGKGWPLGSRLWCPLWVCHFPIGILGQVWYLIVSIPDLCNLTYYDLKWCTTSAGTADSRIPYKQVWQIEKPNTSKHAALSGKNRQTYWLSGNGPSKHLSYHSTSRHVWTAAVFVEVTPGQKTYLLQLQRHNHGVALEQQACMLHWQRSNILTYLSFTV